MLLDLGRAAAPWYGLSRRRSVRIPPLGPDDPARHPDELLDRDRAVLVLAHVDAKPLRSSPNRIGDGLGQFGLADAVGRGRGARRPLVVVFLSGPLLSAACGRPNECASPADDARTGPPRSAKPLMVFAKRPICRAVSRLREITRMTCSAARGALGAVDLDLHRRRVEPADHLGGLCSLRM